jgi:hypothetical protein
VRQSGGEHGGQSGRVQIGEVVAHPPPEGVTEPGVGEDETGQFGARLGDRERLGEQVAQVEDLHAAAAQRLGEGVVLLLGSAHPRDRVEQQGVAVARGQPGQFRPGPVEENCDESSNLAVRVMGHNGQRSQSGSTI